LPQLSNRCFRVEVAANDFRRLFCVLKRAWLIAVLPVNVGEVVGQDIAERWSDGRRAGLGALSLEA